jgi:hypothetical protein
MRYPALLITISLVFATLAPAAQKPGPATRPAQPDFLPAGPFLFEPGTTRPTFMDAFGDRPVVKSPDGRLAVTVTGPSESYGAWVTIDPSAFPDGPVQAWPVQISVDVLWRPDSQAFALTDNRYANLSYVLVLGTRFRMGESGPELGVPMIDLTPVVRRAFDKRAGKYYKYDARERFDGDTPFFYAKALRWVGNDQLLLGVSATTIPAYTKRGMRWWCLGYLVGVSGRKVVRELSKGQLLSEYGIKVAE